MRAWPVALLLAPLALAGCLGDDAPGRQDPLRSTAEGRAFLAAVATPEDECAGALRLPVDLAEIEGPELLHPFGIPDAGHPKGHAGIDFTSLRPFRVLAPGDGVVTRVEDGADWSATAGDRVIVGALACGMTFTAQNLANATVAPGQSIRKGDLLGWGSVNVRPDGTSVLHYDLRLHSDEHAYVYACPSPRYVTPEEAAALGTSTADAGTFMARARFQQQDRYPLLCNGGPIAP